MTDISRRKFLKSTALTGAGLIVAPSIVPSHVFGANAPSERINVGAIGTGRQSQGFDMPGIMKFEQANMMAVCDLDAHRAQDAKTLVKNFYERRGWNRPEAIVYADYEDLLANKDIDAVVVCTPDHWHAKIAIDAVRAGKDIYLEKPTSLTVEEGRLMSNAVNASGRVFQLGSQQRSGEQFRMACEFVRSGRIGKLKLVEVRLPGDPAGGNTEEMPIPAGFNYEKWLGSTPYVYYPEDRVHPQKGYGRPGWLRCEQFGAGMITGWGVHHFDIAHWGMGAEYTGPVEVYGEADFADNGLWDVHGEYHTEMRYADDVIVRGCTDSKEKPNGIYFEGTDGWIFVCRGNYTVLPSDPKMNTSSSALQASRPEIITEPLGENEVHLYKSEDQHGNFLDCVKSRALTVSPAEVAHRSCAVCLLQFIAMHLHRKLYWDPIKERFINDDEANSMLSRPMRAPYNIV